VKATTELPDDPALPGLAAIRAVGVAGALPALDLDERSVEVTLRGYTPGSRVTLEVRAGERRLVHGTFYARHVLDQGDGVGVIDWERFGQGPLELDAGMFLATIWRYGLDHEPLAGEVARAEEALMAGTADLLDERVLAWHRAAALLRLASKVYVVERRKENWLGRADALLREATRLAEFAARPAPVARVEAPVLRLNGAALELILGALSTRPATPEELEQIRKLLSEGHDRAP